MPSFYQARPPKQAARRTLPFGGGRWSGILQYRAFVVWWSSTPIAYCWRNTLRRGSGDGGLGLSRMLKMGRRLWGPTWEFGRSENGVWFDSQQLFRQRQYICPLNVSAHSNTTNWGVNSQTNMKAGGLKANKPTTKKPQLPKMPPTGGGGG